MTMLREIIGSTNENFGIYILKEHMNTKVKISVLPLNNFENQTRLQESSKAQAFSNHSASIIKEWQGNGVFPIPDSIFMKV